VNPSAIIFNDENEVLQRWRRLEWRFTPVQGDARRLGQSGLLFHWPFLLFVSLGAHGARQLVLESAAHKAQALPVSTKDDLLTGREVADIGQCCPTSFTTGNLVNFLKKEAKATSAAEVNGKFVYLTAGSCGACRFGQYHQSYELALRNSGLDAFRMFLLAQDQLDQKAEMGDGLDLNLPVPLGCLWAIFCTDLVQDLEYQVRPFEVVPGQTEAVVKESIELLYQAFRNRPGHGPWQSVLWFLTTGYFVRIMKRIRTNFASIEVDRLRVKPVVKRWFASCTSSS
jgi:hypothetical protein